MGGLEVNYSKKHWILAVVLSTLLVLVIGCGEKKKAPPPPPPPPPKPVTATLSANPASIQRGQSATLTWSTENATDITLEGTKVDASGSQTVSPTSTTTYHLSAKSAGGAQDATATVNVSAPPPPQPPTPQLSDEQVFAQDVKDIYFDYDRADLRPDSQQTLAHAAEVIKAHPNWKVRIEGNCDERGSAMYNLALGERRANAAHQALIQGGVSADQLKTISYGKEKPVCNEATEECWQRNRHDHFSLSH
jgi:peptidoglycan-associated lipoprotein